MANHFYAINRGLDGFTNSDFYMGSSTNAGTDIELRLADAASLTRKDVMIALEAFERLFEMGAKPGGTTFPVL